MSWTVDFYEDAGSSAPVEVFLNGLPKKHRAKLLGLIAKLKEHGPTLPFPYSSQKVDNMATRLDRYYKRQMKDPEIRGLVEKELVDLEVGIKIAGYANVKT
jgi:hypothetical protein